MNRIVSLLLTLLLLVGTPALAADWYVSTTGNAGAAGTEADPWDLQSALTDGWGVVAGDTVWIAGGTYPGAFISDISGTSMAPIVVRAKSGERVVLESNIYSTLDIQGQYTHFRDLEIAGNGNDRVSLWSDPWPAGDHDFDKGVLTGDEPTYSANCKLINVIIHDRGQGIVFQPETDDFEIAGCLFYFNGWAGPDNLPRGCHIWYAGENYPQPNGRVIRNNIFFGGHCYTVRAYLSGDSSLNDAQIVDNTVFDAGLLTPGYLFNEEMILSAAVAIENLVFDRNVFYRRRMSPDNGYAARFSTDGYYQGTLSENISLSLQGNYLVGASVRLYHFVDLTVRDNVMVGDKVMIRPLQNASLTPYPYDWDFNTYYHVVGSGLPFQRVVETDSNPGYDLDVMETWEQWRANTPYDANSSFTSAMPASPIVVVKPDPYTDGRGTVSVINMGEAASASANLSTILDVGQQYEVRDAQNYWGTPVASGTYTGAAVSIPMTGLTPVQPRGHVDPNDPDPPLETIPILWEHSAPKFGAFVVLGGEMGNQPPVVSAGSDQTISLPAPGSLDGTVTDDGNPDPPAALTYTWSMVSGPAAPTFGTPSAVDTTATFVTNGTYVLRLTADDSALSASDDVQIIVLKDLRADFNNDGKVDGLDFLRWQSNFNQWPTGGATKTDGDANGDGKVDGLDFLIWQAGFNR